DRKQAEAGLIRERDKAQQYLDVAGTIFVVIGTDEKVRLINKAGCRMLGAEEGEIVGQNWFATHIPERNRCEIRAVYKLLMAGETEPTEYYENPVLTKDGSERIIAWHNTLLVDEEGKIQGTLSSGEDISERREAEGKLRIKDFAFESSSSADSIGSNDGFLTHANPAFARLWGYENVDEVIGKPILEFLADKDEALEIVEAITNTGKWSGEYQALRKDGSTFIALSYANAIHDVAGNQTALYSSVVDVTDRKKAEQELKQYSEQLEVMIDERTQDLHEAQEELIRKERMATLGQLGGGVAHELRNPLGVISNAVYFLKSSLTDVDDTTVEYLDMISSEISSAIQIIENLLSLTRKEKPRMEETSVEELVVEGLGRRVPPEGVKVSTEISDEMLSVRADPSQIVQVMENLLINAYQAMPDGGELTIKAWDEDSNVLIS
ncbi:PAS domain S-box protein, partial [Candidatus Bipolaricaulota bacterium]|nr:PAS domain S-box protein [Candidatus Bipolaricaulota bacterium]